MITETYHFTSTRFEGIAVLKFNSTGQLVYYDITDTLMSDKMIAWFQNSLPRNLYDLSASIKGSDLAKLTRIKLENITFDQFWDRYNEKAKSSKKKAMQRWNRMTQSERDKAFHYIPVYERSIPAGIARKYAETYLNAELWNN